MDRPPQASAAPPPPPLQEDEDYIFRTQVAFTEFFLKYWKYGGYVLGAVLIVSFAYGGYSSWKQNRAEEEFGAIAAIDYKMPVIDQMAMYGLGPKDDPTDTKRTANLMEGAKRYAAVAQSASGSAATLAWLKSAEAWERAKQPEEVASATAHAAESRGTDVVSFAGDSAHVASLIDAGKQSDAEAALREMSSRYSGFFAEESLIRLAGLQADSGNLDAAGTTWGEITSRFPTTNDPEALATLAHKLGKAVPVAPAPAGEATAAKPAPEG